MWKGGSLRKWLFDGGTKLKQDESKSKDMEAYNDVESKYSELQRRRCRKVVGSFGCAMLGIVLFILFTFGHKIDISFRPRGPEDVYQPSDGTLIDPRVLRRVRFLSDMTDQQQAFLSAENMEQVPKNEVVNSLQKLVRKRLRKSSGQVAERSTSTLRRPLRGIPVTSSFSISYKTNKATDEIDIHDG